MKKEIGPSALAMSAVGGAVIMLMSCMLWHGPMCAYKHFVEDVHGAVVSQNSSRYYVYVPDDQDKVFLLRGQVAPVTSIMEEAN